MLTKSCVSYSVKYLGSCEVSQPKGSEVVKDAVRKLKFACHLKKSEGQKLPKVELQVSIRGVEILDPKSKESQHNCPLHRISFCADDKTDKRILAFICKDAETDQHFCFAFDSEKSAEEITLSIGQAFDLAYRKFLESGGKDVESKKQVIALQKRVTELETENGELQKKIEKLEERLKSTHVVVHTEEGLNGVFDGVASADLFDMVPFSPASPATSPTAPPPIPSRAAERAKDIFGAEPFDPITNRGAGPPIASASLADFPGLVPVLDHHWILNASSSMEIPVGIHDQPPRT
ncbi:PTB domain-containing engulfment adapter protein 1-like isoform X2 [Lampetra fluviatilis]